MKIAIVNDMLWGGGRERRIVQLLKGLAARGVDVHLILLDERVDYPEVFELGVQVTVLKRSGRKDLTVFPRLARVLRESKPDVVNAWSYLSSVYAAVVSIGLRIPFVCALVADCNPPRRMSLEFVAKVIAFRLARIVVSNTRAAHLCYRTPPEKRVVIHNGFDDSRLVGLRERSDVLSEFGLSSDSFVVVMVARFEREKDFSTFLEACRLVRVRGKNISVFCVGQGSLMKSVMDGLSDADRVYVRFPGFRSDVESFIAASDLGVLCTNVNHHQEGISNSLLECMALGKPVVATRGGGTEELVTHGINGYLVDPFGVQEIANHIVDLIEWPDRRSSMGRHAAETVAGRFSLSEMTSNFIRVYEAASA